jgi:hypothetical protein
MRKQNIDQKIFIHHIQIIQHTTKIILGDVLHQNNVGKIKFRNLYHTKQLYSMSKND